MLIYIKPYEKTKMTIVNETKNIDIIDLELLDYLQDVYENEVEDYSIFHIEDYEVDECSYREFHFVSTTREEDEPYYVVGIDPIGCIINKTSHTPTDLIIQIANLSINVLLKYMENMDVRKDVLSNLNMIPTITNKV